jgi:hypothetical protein
MFGDIVSDVYFDYFISARYCFLPSSFVCHFVTPLSAVLLSMLDSMRAAQIIVNTLI